MNRVGVLEQQTQKPVAARAQTENINKIFTVADAVKDIPSGASILLGGFGLCGVPHALCEGLVKVGSKNLTVYSGTAQSSDWGAGVLLRNGQIKRMCSSYMGENPLLKKLYLKGELEIEFIPQGTLAERLRAGGSGIPGFFTPTAFGTMAQEGGFPNKLNKDGTPAMIEPPKEVREFDGKFYVMEKAIKGDFALIKAWKADRCGNLQFRGTARSFNPPCAVAGKVCIAEVEEIVEVGTFDPNQIHLPGIYVHRIVCPPKYEKKIEFLTLRKDSNGKKAAAPIDPKNMSTREKLARRAALEFRNGMYCNLGIGIPSLAANYLPPGMQIELQCENGMLGMGPYPTKETMDPDLTSASKQLISYLPSSSLFTSDQSFAMIRGGHMDMTMLGGLQVSGCGDLANWLIPGKKLNGMGGAMDLVGSGARVVIVMEHMSKGGKSKILPFCTLPLTGRGVVSRLITEMAVFDFEKKGFTTTMVLKEIAPGLSLEQVKKATEASFQIAPEVKTIQYAGIDV